MVIISKRNNDVSKIKHLHFFNFPKLELYCEIEFMKVEEKKNPSLNLNYFKGYLLDTLLVVEVLYSYGSSPRFSLEGPTKVKACKSYNLKYRTLDM